MGVFDVKAKFMGVHLETVMLEYQVSPHHLDLIHYVIFNFWIIFNQTVQVCILIWCDIVVNKKLVCVCVSQDLLQLQYEGVAVMKLFDRATINVNLLIFLLNKKFYGK